MISCRAPLLMRGILIASIEEIIRVIIVQNAKFILGADATVQRLAVFPELDIGESRRNAAVAVGVEGIDVDGGADVTAGVDRQRVGDLHSPAIDHAGLFLTGGVDEIAVRIGGILRAIHIAVAQREFQIWRNLSAPLGYAFLFGLLDGFPDLSDRHGIALGNDEGAAVLGFAAVDALGLENVNEGCADLSGDDFDGHSSFLSAHIWAFNLVCTFCTKMLLIVAVNDYSLKSPAASEYGLRGSVSGTSVGAPWGLTTYLPSTSLNFFLPSRFSRSPTPSSVVL